MWQKKTERRGGLTSGKYPNLARLKFISNNPQALKATTNSHKQRSLPRPLCTNKQETQPNRLLLLSFFSLFPSISNLLIRLHPTPTINTRRFTPTSLLPSQKPPRQPPHLVLDDALPPLKREVLSWRWGGSAATSSQGEGRGGPETAEEGCRRAEDAHARRWSSRGLLIAHGLRTKVSQGLRMASQQ